MTQPPENDPASPTPPSPEQRSLRGSFVAVLCMAAFFVVAWLGMLALALERR